MKLFKCWLSGQRYGGDASRKNSHSLKKTDSPAASNAPTVSQGSSCTSTPEVLRGSPGRPRKAKTHLKEHIVKKSLNRNQDNDNHRGPSSSSIYSRVSQKTSSVSPAPPRNHQPISNRFGFSPVNNPKSGDSTDSLNSILSDVITTSDSNFNLCDIEDTNGNRKAPSRPVSDCISDASSCTISQASSGVTTAVLNSRLKAQTRQLPKPQTVSPLTKPLSTTSHLKTPHRANREVPKVKTTDSGFASASECEKIVSDNATSRESLRSTTENSPKLELDVSDAWLQRKHAFLAGPVTQQTPMDSNPQRRTEIGKEKQSVVTYGMARQKLAPYNRKRFGFIGPSAVTDRMPSSPKVTPGSVKSRIAQLESTPKATQPQRLSLSSPRKPISRPVPDKTPGETVKSNRNEPKTYRKLDYNESRKFLRTKKTESPKLQRPLSSGVVPASAKPKPKDALTQSASALETVKIPQPNLGSRQDPKTKQTRLPSVKSPDSDSSFVVITESSATNPDSSEILDQVTPIPKVSAKTETEKTVRLSKELKSSEISSESIKSTSCDRLTSGKCTPVMGSTRGENDQDFFDDEISDQPGLTFGDGLDVSLFDDEVLFPDEPISSPSRRSKRPDASRSRAESACTTSSFGADDLMLDYDPEDQKPSLGSTVNDSTSDTQKRALEVLISGGRYEEPVKSPVVSDVVHEWSTMLAEHKEARLPTDSCVSRESFCLPPSHASPTTQSPAHSTASRTASAPVKSRPGSTASDHIVFKPPRQSSSENSEVVPVDRNTLHYMTQDVTSVKTQLLRLKRLLQATDNTNPFEPNMNSYYLNLGALEATSETSPSDILQENVDLKRQVILLQQQMAEKDRAIQMLEDKLSQCMQPSLGVSSQSTCMQCSTSSDSSQNNSSSSINAATQTDRSNQRLSHLEGTLARTSSMTDGLGPTVSSDVCKSSYANGDAVNGLFSETSSCLVSSNSSFSS